MYMQNLSGGLPGSVSTDTEKARHRSAIQREIMMRELDYKRSVNEKIQVEAELKRLKNEEAHIRLSLQEKQTRLLKLEQDIARSDGELRDLKKKLNTL
jgi:septal ring factor EnvC (AmiA/AmiB activator)